MTDNRSVHKRVNLSGPTTPNFRRYYNDVLIEGPPE